MIKIDRLTAKEVILLNERRRKSGTLLIRDRCHAILLNKKNYNAVEIADILDRDRSVVEGWLNNLAEGRVRTGNNKPHHCLVPAGRPAIFESSWISRSGRTNVPA